ncbi:MAG: CHAD domain-containing protein [Alphaproteobacteria bacterium]|nr:CHAD domain-containing protein [Alphaproteobacteria bacterium]MDE2629973.1 CHAD domain-containing protein [Alphaproteobacteria bacterium]
MDQTRSATVRSTGHHRLHEVQNSAAAVTARPLRLRGSMSLEDAFRTTVLECLAHVAANISPVIRVRDVEGLHQLRVGLRRLHVAFSAFGDEFRTPAIMDLKARAKAFADAIAPARDLDVFIEELFLPMAEKLGHDEAFKILRARAEDARLRAWDEAVEHVASVEFAVFQDDVAAAAEARSWLGGRDVAIDLKARLAVREPVMSAAGRMMDEHMMRVRKRGRRVKSLEQREMHRLRIALKRLRYVAEFYGPLYKRKSVKRYLEHLKKLQDLLGALNDVAQVRSVLARLIADETTTTHTQADLCFAAGLINGWHRAGAERTAKKALRRWDKFKRQRPFWA